MTRVSPYASMMQLPAAAGLAASTRAGREVAFTLIDQPRAH